MFCNVERVNTWHKEGGPEGEVQAAICQVSMFDEALVCRYVYMDDMLLGVRASPASKAATLSRDSQALVHAVRADLDEAALRGDREVHRL